MESDYLKAQEILNKYNQKHLLSFYEELTEEQQEQLTKQILNINFKQILELYNNSMIEETVDLKTITPLQHIEKEKLSKDEINKYMKIGEEQIKLGKLAVVTMAGGQGTRLGYKGPKGTYELELEQTKKSLFQIMCEDIKRANKKYNVIIPWFIMTSEENDNQTKEYFNQNSYFGYPAQNIFFFTQEKLPIIDTEGKLILDKLYHIKEASNGNGNVFISMKKHKIIQKIEEMGINWVSFGGIDNVLLKNVDPLFLGMMINEKQKIAAKTRFKKLPLEKEAVYCKKNGKPSILDYVDINLEISERKDENGNYLYREANMLSHLMDIEAIKEVSTVKLKYHRAYKKNDFINFEGVKQVATKPNTFKFENFIFDAFSYFDSMLLLRVNSDEEFAPIKDFTGIYNPENAKEKYEKYWKIKNKNPY